MLLYNEVFLRLNCRGFPFLEPSARGSLVESLCSNLAVLITSITAQSHASSESTEDAAYMLQQMHLHRNALKIYSYFLQCVLIMEEAAEVKPVLKATTGKVCYQPSKFCCRYRGKHIRYVRMVCTLIIFPSDFIL